MPETISIYLAGNIQKGHEKESAIFWINKDMEQLKENAFPIEIIFLNPANRTDDLSDQKSVFDRDMTQVFLSDIVLIDARERRGLGVGAEMMWAKMLGKTVITLAPIDSHYRKNQCTFLGQTVNNWIHPFIESLSDHIVADLFGAAEYIKGQNRHVVKNHQYIQEAMQHYQMTQFEKDSPMHKLITAQELLLDRFANIKDTKIFPSVEKVASHR